MLLGACARNPRPAPLPARGPARDSLIQLDRSRADSVRTLGPIEGMLSLLGADVAYLSAGAPTVYGLEAARRLHAADPPAAGTLFTWHPLGGELSADHRSAYTFGVAARVAPQATGELHLDRYIAFWHRDVASNPAARWRITAYSDVGTGPPRAPGVLPEDLIRRLGQPSARAAELIAKLRTTDSAFSDLADRMGLAEAFSTYVAPDGAIFNGSELVIGPRALRDFFTATNGGLALTWQPMFAGIAESEDLGFTVGDYVATLRGPSGAAVQRFGKYLTVWKRQRDGSWKFVIDGGSASPPKNG
jgi:ketosteroid isomerase-like protein